MFFIPNTNKKYNKPISLLVYCIMFYTAIKKLNLLIYIY